MHDAQLPTSSDCESAYHEHSYRDRGSWKKTLHDKAIFFENNTAQRHNILGSFPSSVGLIPPKHYAGLQNGAWRQIVETGELPSGWTFDHGTTGISNVAHTSSWTACLLTSQAFRVAFLRKTYGEQSPEYQVAYERANEIINSFRILTLVSGQPGYLARGFALGHGVSYEESAAVGTRDLWAQGAGEFCHLRYRGGPSHHNYNQVFRGLGIYYFVAADNAQKQAIGAIVTDMSNWAHLNNNLIVMHHDNKRISTELVGGWRGLGGDDKPSHGSLMMLTGILLAYRITGNEKLNTLYNTWIDRLGFRDPKKTQANIMGAARADYDDTDHLVGDLYLLNIIEQDEQLRTYYKKCARDSHMLHKDEKMAWFNYVYRVVLGDQYGDLEGSLWNLQTHPTCRVFQPQMNSIRTDIEFHTECGEKLALHPLPVHERPSDNEYEWKGSPYRLDGWLSRIVSILEVSPHDPYVQFAADTAGYSYWSNTRGEVWHEIKGLSHVKDFLFSCDYPWIIFAATDDGVYRTLNGGDKWTQVFDQPVSELCFDPDNANVLYAVGPNGIYKSADLGEADMGAAWRSVGAMPANDLQAVYAIAAIGGEPVRLHMLTRHGFYSKTVNEPEWTALPQTKRVRGFSEVDPIGGQPIWLRADPLVPDRLFRAIDLRYDQSNAPTISVSDDAGRSWTPVIRALKPLVEWLNATYTGKPMPEEELRRLVKLATTDPITDLKVDRNAPDVWYGLTNAGIAVTEDAGKTWHVNNDGLDIAAVEALWTPRHAKLVAIGTPAGMYVSNDRAKSWTDTSLILQFEGAMRYEIGGIGYLTAYWMGRYHGFISEQQATADWWDKPATASNP